ncbi:hypothetical protein C7974DRAFT_449589 [Boeremia exigua]|uniref:uncharacterized protein n=1 Tax=Boeremia exigua TaxID=749465 RepID=UPI001E8CDA79|nr:uncharacterized protein C7974DRAFT_449589 [Boeremia exigua]KAH6639504.1 hypothetical protein C7974DRAFT_449589 [Boeremia exigua]
MGAGVNAGCGFGDANREQSHPQQREQCIRQQSRRSSALERGASRLSSPLRVCPTPDLQRTTAKRSIDELKARFLRVPHNRPCIGAPTHVFSRKNRVYSPKAHRWVYWRGDGSRSAHGWHGTAGPPSVSRRYGNEVDRPDSVSLAAVAERFYDCARGEAHAGRDWAAHAGYEHWRAAVMCAAATRSVEAVRWALSYFCASRASALQGSHTLPLAAPCSAAPPLRLAAHLKAHHLRTHAHRRRRLPALDVIAVPAYRPPSRARRPGDSALPHANRLSHACPGSTMTKQEGTRGLAHVSLISAAPHPSSLPRPAAWRTCPVGPLTDLIFINTPRRRAATLPAYSATFRPASCRPVHERSHRLQHVQCSAAGISLLAARPAVKPLPCFLSVCPRACSSTSTHPTPARRAAIFVG